jgi:hypothetical protein
MGINAGLALLIFGFPFSQSKQMSCCAPSRYVSNLRTREHPPFDPTPVLLFRVSSTSACIRDPQTSLELGCSNRVSSIVSSHEGNPGSARLRCICHCSESWKLVHLARPSSSSGHGSFDAGYPETLTTGLLTSSVPYTEAGSLDALSNFRNQHLKVDISLRSGDVSSASTHYQS